MNSHTFGDHEVCSVCDSDIPYGVRNCPTCSSDVGVPNVRLCRTKENIKALEANYDLARSRAKAGGYSEAFNKLGDLVKDKSGVVITMPVSMARRLIDDPREIYTNYNKLVGAGIRTPAAHQNDLHRCTVGAVLFGSYANFINYGALSLTEYGIPTYGSVHCRLRTITIDKRTNFLETNSYKFVSDHNIVPGGKLPAGHTACWENRHMLVLSKLVGSLSNGQDELDWQALLIQSDGQDRGSDEFIEALIYDGFDIKAIESMVISSDVKLNKREQLDLDLALDTFKKIKGKRN